MKKPKPDPGEGQFEAYYGHPDAERGPLRWAGAVLSPGEWVGVTAAQAEALKNVPGVSIRARGDLIGSEDHG